MNLLFKAGIYIKVPGKTETEYEIVNGNVNLCSSSAIVNVTVN